MMEAYTTLGFLAARSNRLRLGTLVSCVTHRNIAHLAKIVATLDVLSQGRAWCGLGLGWFADEHVAKAADACNLFGEPEVIEHKLEVLDRHCEVVGRDRSEIEITQLSAILSAPDQASLDDKIDRLKPSGSSPIDYADRALAATTEHHIDRFARLAAAGVQTAIVSLADVGEPCAVADFAPIIDTFRP